MNETGSGLFYSIYEKTEGEHASKGKIALLNFNISLLNGKEVYSSDEKGVIEFEIGKGNVESGLEEGVLLMKTGEKARLIIPSHLAHGLSGDHDKIPEKATIVYDVELIKLIEKSETLSD
jgi:FKBP-type peptidyl-prolyl cis-trans isomerase FkpA